MKSVGVFITVPKLRPLIVMLPPPLVAAFTTAATVRAGAS
jgi:hypothetical protein